MESRICTHCQQSVSKATYTIYIWFPGCVQGQKCLTASQQKSTDETAVEEMDFDIQATDDSACTVHIHPVDNNALSTV